jgi:subtilisin-like proprotein convertase family protein
MRKTKAWLSGIFLIFSLLIFCGNATAINQRIELKSDWNLISFAVQPTNSEVEAVLDEIITNSKFIAIWTYDAASETWSTYPAPLDAIPAIDHIETNKGYWLNVTSATTLTIQGGEAMPSGSKSFVAGWNLVGFSANEAKPYDRVFYGVPVREIWKYDAAAGQFKGVELPASPGPPILEDFTELEPCIGYWVYASEPFTLEPFLGTAMEGDKDVPPLLTDEPVPGERLVWSDFTPGDEDIGMDGYYDRPDTQRALTFRDNMTSQNISIYNTGSGILTWTAQIDNPEDNFWLRFAIMDEEEGKEVFVESLSGSLTTDTVILKVVTDRTGLPSGDYEATITITGNGSGDEPIREIRVYMNVATIDGDYKIIAHIDTVDDKKADMHNPRLFLSLYNDRDGLKGIIDDHKTLLMPKRFYMTGAYYEEGTNHFILSGSLELPVGHADNPYKVRLRRDITLIGDRAGSDDAMLGPLDLKGEYRETIRNVLKEPIYLAGTFTATRIQSQPSTIDSSDSGGEGGLIPDDGTTLEKIIDISERMIITEVDVTVNLTHSRPADLVVTLVSPTGTEVRLRKRTTAIVGKVTYDMDETPVDSMEDFNEEMSDGIWTLIVDDQESGETGTLVSWSLDIKGTRVYSINGTVANVGEGASVLLTGCGLSLITTTGPGGIYSFDDLINGIYSITVSEPGYESNTTEVGINGQDEEGFVLNPKKIVAADADFIFNPISGLKPLIVEFVDISPPDVFETDHGYTYTWTLRKLVDGTPQPYTVRSGEGSQIIQTFDQRGTYISKMEIFDQASPGTPIATVDKPDQYITVGPSEDSSYILTSYSILGSGGWYGNEDAFDSATFDIDRPPYDAENPGLEDTNAFTSEVNPLTITNQVGTNMSIDGPVGPDDDLSHHAHIYVNIGQPVIGLSVSGDKVLSIGANP